MSKRPILEPYRELLYGSLPPNLFLTKDMPSDEESLAPCEHYETDQLGCMPARKPTSRILRSVFSFPETRKL